MTKSYVAAWPEERTRIEHESGPRPLHPTTPDKSLWRRLMERPYTLHLGDCLEVLHTLPDSSIDSIVTDPPYGLSKEPEMTEVLRHWLAGDDYQHKGSGFMGKSWDSFVPGPAIWREALRVLKPGGHLLAFFGSRTYDMGTLSIRLAGFEIRDQIMWLYGSGFPKSRNLDGEWQGWGTALKPAHEPICVARKPLAGTVTTNVLEHGTGALNIDGCRIAIDPHADATQLRTMQRSQRSSSPGWGMSTVSGDAPQVVRPDGRWPANLILSDDPEALAGFPVTGAAKSGVRDPNGSMGCHGGASGLPDVVPGYDDYSGSAARFFFCA